MTAAQVEQRRRNNAAIAETRRAATHCGRGHELTPEGVLIRADGRRECRTCHNDRQWYAWRGIPWVR